MQAAATAAFEMYRLTLLKTLFAGGLVAGDRCLHAGDVRVGTGLGHAHGAVRPSTIPGR
jgi:hypothetical protein